MAVKRATDVVDGSEKERERESARRGNKEKGDRARHKGRHSLIHSRSIRARAKSDDALSSIHSELHSQVNRHYGLVKSLPAIKLYNCVQFN